jgi:hypothetical protein
MAEWMEYEFLMTREYEWDQWLTQRSLENEPK